MRVSATRSWAQLASVPFSFVSCILVVNAGDSTVAIHRSVTPFLLGAIGWDGNILLNCFNFCPCYLKVSNSPPGSLRAHPTVDRTPSTLHSTRNCSRSTFVSYNPIFYSQRRIPNLCHLGTTCPEKPLAPPYSLFKNKIVTIIESSISYIRGSVHLARIRVSSIPLSIDRV